MDVLKYWIPILGLYFLLKDAQKPNGGFYDSRFYVGDIAPLYQIYQVTCIAFILILTVESIIKI